MTANPLLVHEKILTRQDLAEADTIFVANSVRGLVEVQLSN
jgi:branched-subunit amino acid aminotransferase/4-amino-4-deoxychorismate lyase